MPKPPKPPLLTEGDKMQARFASTDQRQSHHLGFTLFEMIIVLSIVAVALGITIPAMLGTLKGQRWKESLGDTQAFVSSIRQQAITSGETWWIRYALDQSVMIAGPEFGTVGETLQLPDDIQFLSAGQYGEQIDALELGLSNPDWSNWNWSPMILFSPDGSTIDSLIDLKGPDQQTRQILIRGLTGHPEILP